MAKETAIGISSQEIDDIEINETQFYIASEGVSWFRYTAMPVTQITNPAIGIMKMLPGETWEYVNFGTAGMTEGVPQGVIDALNLTD